MNFLTAGGDPDQFWRLTLRQVALFVRAFSDRRRADLDLAYYTAYWSGFFSQPFKNGKFPDFKKFQPSRQAKKAVPAQSWKEQKRIARMGCAMLGGDFKTRDDT